MAKTPTLPTGGAGKGSHIVWQQPNPLGPGWGKRFQLHFHAGLAAFTTGFAKQVEDYAREHAPWNDRTGDARRGLTAKGKQRLVYYEIELFHTVDYGVWLEVRWSGKYAIIQPTLEVMGPRLMAELDMYLIMKAGGG